jgi:hypothetical protein
VTSAGTADHPGGVVESLVDAREALVELAPLLRRALQLDPAVLVRLRGGGTVAAVLSLPFGVLVGRTVPARGLDPDLDVTVGAADLVGWVDNSSSPPVRRDAEWRGAVPPRTGWRRLETVPDDTVRGLVRQGARAVQAAAAREGVPGAQLRAEVADALLDCVVITAGEDPELTRAPVEVTLRVLSAMTRMGFVPRGSHVGLDVCGRWVRVAAEYGSGYLQRPGSRLPLLR